MKSRKLRTVLIVIAAMIFAYAVVKFKCWYYEKAMADGSEDEINKMLPDKLPPDIQKIYDKAHSKE